MDAKFAAEFIPPSATLVASIWTALIAVCVVGALG